MKLLTSSIAMGDVERCHKVTARTKSKVSNSKLDSTTEVYCKIAVSESKADILQAFRSHVKDMRKLRAERESAAQALQRQGQVAGLMILRSMMEWIRCSTRLAASLAMILKTRMMSPIDHHLLAFTHILPLSFRSVSILSNHFGMWITEDCVNPQDDPGSVTTSQATVS